MTMRFAGAAEAPEAGAITSERISL